MERPIIDRRAVPPGAVFSQWRSPDGWSHRRMEWPQPEGAPVRGSLLFAGGRGDFIEKYFEAHHHWHEGGWNVAALDWRGQGGSRGNIEGGHLESLDVLVEDLSALLAEWLASTPAPHVAVGHSMGGHVLLRTLAERKPPLAAAVLVAPMLMINSAPLPPWAAAWTARLFARLGLARVPAWRDRGISALPGSPRQGYLTSCPDRYADESWWWCKEPGFKLGPPSLGWVNAAYRSCARLTVNALSGLTTPTLLVGTERDRLVSAAAIRRAAATIPKAELLMFEGAGHEILREADPVRLRALAGIDSFLDSHAPL